MPPRYRPPGTYPEETPRDGRVIEGAPTSITVFVGVSSGGMAMQPMPVRNWKDFEARFGGLSANEPLGYAIEHFFSNGGGQAYVVAMREWPRTGDLIDVWAVLEGIDFNLLCLPPPARNRDHDLDVHRAAIDYCEGRGAFYIADSPRAWSDASDPVAAARMGIKDFPRSPNAALYFPWLVAPDPLDFAEPDAFAPCGAIAGVFARTDAEYGVWRAPAGNVATLGSFFGLTVQLNDRDNGDLNGVGIDCLRVFPPVAPIVWGARTLAGADSLTSDWKYIPISRLDLFIRQSVSRGTRWAVNQPNDEKLWSALRLSIFNFLDELFRLGAFKGDTPSETYFVQCGAHTMTQAEIDNGIVNVIIGFAPLQPAEFITIKLKVLAKSDPMHIVTTLD